MIGSRRAPVSSTKRTLPSAPTCTLLGRSSASARFHPSPSFASRMAVCKEYHTCLSIVGLHSCCVNASRHAINKRRAKQASLLNKVSQRESQTCSRGKLPRPNVPLNHTRTAKCVSPNLLEQIPKALSLSQNPLITSRAGRCSLSLQENKLWLCRFKAALKTRKPLAVLSLGTANCISTSPETAIKSQTHSSRTCLTHHVPLKGSPHLGEQN